MTDDTIFTEGIRTETGLTIDAFIQQGAQRTLTAALQPEIDEYI